jgi:coenzyme F420-reducing hydrogenase delta subunit
MQELTKRMDKMKKRKYKPFNRDIRAYGFTLLELMTTIVITVIPISVVGILLVGGQRNWNQTYLSVNKQIKIDAQTAASVFSKIGRNASRFDSVIMSESGMESIPDITEEDFLSGQVVEFRFWQPRPVGKGSRSNPKPADQPTDYARFYRDPVDNTLNVDYGPYPYKIRIVASTRILARNVVSLEFNQMGFNGVKQNCIRMNLVLSENKIVESEDNITVMATALMRN